MGRNISSELFRVKNAYDESTLQLEEVRRENKSLSNEIKDIMDQITEGGRSIHEIEKRIAQKDEEFASTKKNFGKALEGMQMALEGESKGKIEALRMKKKLEADVIDLHTALEHDNAANAESQRQIKVIQNRLREV